MKQFIKNAVDTQLNNECFGKFNMLDDVELEIQVLTNGEVGESWTNPTFELIGIKMDRNEVRQIEGVAVVSLETHTIKVVLDKEFTTKDGVLDMQLVVKDAGRVSTCVFSFLVGKSLEGQIVESVRKIDTLDDLDQVVANLRDFEQNMGVVSEEINNTNRLVNENEMARKTNELKRANKENLRIAAEEIRQSNENLRVALYEEALPSEEERQANEEERLVNETNRKIAEQTRISNENSRIAAEQNRNEVFELNEGLRNAQENKRVANENSRIDKFNDLMNQEIIRVAAENNRLVQEVERENNEAHRVNAEATRQAQEAHREATYTTFNEKEKQRQAAETLRANAETQRQAAETLRNQNYDKAEASRNKMYEDSEAQRNAEFGDAEGVRQATYTVAEQERYTAYNAAELVRNNNEELRKSNETKRQAAENTRIQNEELRIQKESTRDAKVQEFLERGEQVISDIEIETDEFIQRGEEVITDIETRTDAALQILEGSAEEVAGMRKDYMGKVHASMKLAADSNVDYAVKTAIGEFNYLDYEGQHITATNSIEGHARSAILKGVTGYKDVDTGEILETFEEGRNLELVSVKMPVLTTTGKNLFDGQIIRNACLGTNGGHYNLDGAITFAKMVYVKGLKEICLSISNSYDSSMSMVYSLYDKNKNFICRAYGNYISGTGAKFSISDDVYYLRVTFHTFSTTAIGDDVDIKIQLEESLVATPYEPYKSNILSTPNDLELRGIGDVQDTLDLTTGELTQRIEEVVFDGSEDWSLNRSTTNHNLWTTTIANPALNTTVRKNNMLCNKLIVEDFSGFDAKDYEFISINNGNSNWIYLKLDKTKGSTATELKNYLQSNPLTVQYQLATESIKTVDLSDNVVYSYDNITHYSCSSEEGSLVPTLSVKVPTDVQATIAQQRNTIQALESENEALKDGLIEANQYREDGDMDLLSNQWDIDFRLFEIEMALDVPMMATFKLKETDIMSRFLQAKTLILGGRYERSKMEYQLKRYLEAGQLTQEEYDELISLMDARELVE